MSKSPPPPKKKKQKAKKLNSEEKERVVVMVSVSINCHLFFSKKKKTKTNGADFLAGVNTHDSLSPSHTMHKCLYVRIYIYLHVCVGKGRPVKEER